MNNVSNNYNNISSYNQIPEKKSSFFDLICCCFCSNNSSIGSIKTRTLVLWDGGTCVLHKSQENLVKKTTSAYFNENGTPNKTNVKMKFVNDEEYDKLLNETMNNN